MSSLYPSHSRTDKRVDGDMEYGVFQWTDGRGGQDRGFVVREGSKTKDGSIYYPKPYHDQKPVKTYKRRHHAEKHADKLNGY